MKSFVTTSILVLFLSCFGYAGSHAGWIENGVPLTHQWDAPGEEVSAPDGSSGAIIAYHVCHDGVGRIIAQRIDSLGAVLWGDEGVEVCTASGDQANPVIISDGLGGAIVAWHGFRSGNYDIYTQRVNASGAAQWTADGVALCTATANQTYPAITPDGAGGAIVMWSDYRNGHYDTYAQRVSASGDIQWTVNGVFLSTAAASQQAPQITSDGAGGAIVTWKDSRSGINGIYAQRVNASGSVEWTTDGVALCTALENRYYPKIASDSAGGAIVTWFDYRSQSTYDIYAQRVDASGVVRWTIDGIPLSTGTGDQQNPEIISDGAGGAIVTWRDTRVGNYDIYAQKVNASGAVQWTANGVALCAATGSQGSCAIASDGAAGAIVTWQDSRSGNSDIYAQKVDASGAVQWTADGVALCFATGDQVLPTITSDGASGAIVTWNDLRYGYSDVYAQRVNTSGAVQWTANGVVFRAAAGNKFDPHIISDGAGGAIVTWQNVRTGSSDIHAQRINASGAVQWTENGVSLCSAMGDQQSPQITSDGAGGAIVTWNDLRYGYSDVYAQRVSASGSVLWATDGVALCTATGYQWYPMITSDGAGGAIVTWYDSRSGSYDIYAQRVDASGTVQWTPDGVALCTAVGTQQNPQIISDGAGGAAVTWIDSRSGSNPNIFVQRVNASGAVQWTANGVALCTALGNQGSCKIISDGLGGAIVTWWDYRIMDYDIYAQRVNASGTVEWTADGVSLCTTTGTQYSPELASDGASGAIVTWHDARSGTRDIYAQRVNASGTIQWTPDGVALCTATGNQNFPTITSDGEGGAIVAWQDNRCGALMFAQRVRSSGEIVSTMLRDHAAARAARGIRVDWSLSEMDGGARFSILRASAPEWRFVELKGAAIEKNGLSFTCTDESCLPGSTYKYRVECEVGGAARRVLFETDAITMPALPLTLYQNHPNPFNPRTLIRFYLPETQEIYLDVYNVAGERVARLAEGKWEKGYHEVLWDGRNGSGTVCSSGVYFSRLKAGKVREVRKMILLK